MKIKGMTVTELFTAVAILSSMLLLGISGWQSFPQRFRLHQAMRLISTMVSMARYHAIDQNKPVSLSIENGHLVIRKKLGEKNWQILTLFQLPPQIHVSLNMVPVFYPSGTVTPVCTFLIGNKIKQYRITLSIMGRIKVYPN